MPLLTEALNAIKKTSFVSSVLGGAAAIPRASSGIIGAIGAEALRRPLLTNMAVGGISGYFTSGSPKGAMVGMGIGFLGGRRLNGNVTSAQLRSRAIRTSLVAGMIGIPIGIGRKSIKTYEDQKKKFQRYQRIVGQNFGAERVSGYGSVFPGMGNGSYGESYR
jgi:hypothetical protein